jgi:hypothetical protein
MFRREKLMQGDMASRATVAATLRSNGIIDGNEARTGFGYNPHPDGDTLLANGTFTPVSVLNKKTNTDQTRPDEPQERPEPTPAGNNPEKTAPQEDPEDAPE